MSAIDDKYASLGGPTGVLGPATSTEQACPDGVGRFRHFTGGSIYWTRATAAHEVHGSIHALWESLGWETSTLGYPTSDEIDTPHHIGRVSHFQHGSIYWDANRGAYEVFPRPDFLPSDPASQGRWKVPSYSSGVVGMHAALLHNAKILFFAYMEPRDPENPGPIPPDLGESAVLDLSSHEIATPSYTGTSGATDMPNIFCSGHALLPDGRLLVAGGDRETQSRIRSLHVFTADSAGGAWRYLGQCAKGRWYATCATLPDGRVVIVGGEKRIEGPKTRNTTFEVFDGTTETVSAPISQPAMEGVGAYISYPFVYVLPNNKLLVHGGTHTTSYNLPDLTFDGTAIETIRRDSRTYGIEGTSVLLPLLPNSSPPHRARVMVIGGGREGSIRTPATKSCEILDTSASTPAWKLAAPMLHARVMPDAVLLPDGTVFVTNGSSRGHADNGANPVWEAELYNPRTDTWTEMAPMTVPRLYHATALLLPDGRVMTAGTDSVWNPDPFHSAETRVEIFSPPYLTSGPRPTISTAPNSVTYGDQFTIETPDAQTITSVALMRCGSSTHSFNPDQRHVGLRIVGRSATTLAVMAPPDSCVAPPGYYLVFILRDGVPSVARYVKVKVKVPVRYMAAWIKSTTGEYQMYDVSYATYRARYDELWPQNWRLNSLSVVVVKGKPLYTAVWRPGSGGETQIYGATYAQYRARYDELWLQGWRLKLLTRYAIGSQIRYTAAWVPGTGGEYQIYDATFTQFKSRYDELWPQGWRLKLIDVITVDGEPRYTAAWSPSTVGEYQIYGATYKQFKSRYDELWDDGWRLKFISTYNSDGPRITAVWRQTREPESWVHGWEYVDLRVRYNELWSQGWRLKILDRYTV